jgi:hypothetical protein
MPRPAPVISATLFLRRIIFLLLRSFELFVDEVRYFYGLRIKREKSGDPSPFNI